MENPIPVTEIAAIDVHGHYGDYHVDQLPTLINQFHGAGAATVLRRAELAHTG